MDKLASDNNNNNSQRETHDFMNVESFSQLPFIRPTPLKEKSGGAIRLFGKEFGRGNETLITDNDSDETNNNNESSSKDDSKTNNNNEGSSVSGAAVGGSSGGISGESSRRFECHYCCRNFPTSQALGGHQNAHKRERQHAKRAHLQSSMAHGGAGEAHVYGLINYHHHQHHRFGPSPKSSHQYPSWNSHDSGAAARFYGAAAAAYPPAPRPQPINGSPLAMWRIPAAVSGGGSILPVFSGEEVRVPAMNSGGSGGGGNNRGFAYHHHDTKPASVTEHVSLDLHL